MKRLLIAILFALTPFVAWSATGNATLSYQRPTTFTDGSALAAAQIASYTVTCTFRQTGQTATTPCTLSSTTIPGGTSSSGSVTLTYPAAGGEACFRLATNVNGYPPSDPSGESCKTFAAIQPSPPTGVTVTVIVAVTITPTP